MPNEQEYHSTAKNTAPISPPPSPESAPLPAEEIALPVSEERLFLPWLAVLASQRIPYRVQYSENRKILLIPATAIERARHELAEYEKNTAAWQRRVETIDSAQPLLSDRGFFSALFFAFSLLHFHLWYENADCHWRSLGVWEGALIRKGQWWRCLTALTLHSDYAHLLTNMFWGGTLLALVANEFGAGWGLTLMLSAGALGNALNAWLLPQAQYQALGASTMVFALLGMLSSASTCAVWRQRRQGRGTFRIVQLWLPFLAGCGMLALYGTAPGTDLGGHLNGFLAGLLLGLLAKKLPQKYCTRHWQWSSAVLALSVLFLAWIRAWSQGRLAGA